MEQFLTELGKQGVLGIILAISFFLNWYFIRTIQDLNEKRVNDAKEITTRILEPLTRIESNGQLLIDLLQTLLKKNGNIS